MINPIYKIIARKIAALSTINEDIASDDLDYLEKEYLPSGSGFDNGTQIDRSESNPNKLVLVTSFHHMDSNGFYNGWTQHKVIVRPCLQYGFDFKVTGPNRNDIKDYIESVFQNALLVEFDTNNFPK